MIFKNKFKIIVKKIGQKLYRAFFSVDIDNSFVNKHFTTSLMNHFHADELGHRAKIKNSDLGYGWIHYAFIRNIKPKNILCIGSRYGYIPSILAQACKENRYGHVDFIDPGYGDDNENHWTGVAYWKSNEGKKCFREFGLKKWISLHLMTSKEFFLNNKKKYDYIYIDGDHSYKGVVYDYENCWKILNKEGIISFHDISINKKLPEGKYGVNKLWKKITSNNEGIELNFSKSGLGILQKK